jgi:hypothetical protein
MSIKATTTPLQVFTKSVISLTDVVPLKILPDDSS